MKKYVWAVAACIGVYCLGLFFEIFVLDYHWYTGSTFGFMFRQLLLLSAIVAVWRAILKRKGGGIQMDKQNPSTYHAETSASSAKANSPAVNDDAFYDEVAKEIETNKLISGVWVRAFAEADGDENRAKAIYIKRRVAQLSEVERLQRDEAKRATMPAGGDAKVVSWEVVNARWVRNTYANGDVTMSDKDTGLMWLYNANPCEKKKWVDAVEYCDSLSYAGYSDWRLPSKEELSKQWFGKDCFAGVKYNFYWSSTLFGEGRAWGVGMYGGGAAKDRKDRVHNVWPVRGGQ